MTSNAYSPPGFMGIFVIGCAMANQSPQTEPPDLQKQDPYQNEDQLQQESRRGSCQNQLLPQHTPHSNHQFQEQDSSSAGSQSTQEQISTTEQLCQGILKVFWKCTSQSRLLLPNSVQNGKQEKQLQQGYQNRSKNGFATTENIQTQAQMKEEDVQQLKQDQTNNQQRIHVLWEQMLDQVQMSFQDYQQHSQPTEPTGSQVSRQSSVPVQGYVQFHTQAITQSLQTSTTESVTDVCNHKLPGTSWMGHRMAVLAY